MGIFASKNIQSHKTVLITDADASKPPAITFSKQVLDFNAMESGCPINTPVFDEVELTNTLTKKIKFKFEPVHPTSCQLFFIPSSGVLDKLTSSKKSKKIKVKLVILERINLNFKVTIRIQGGESLFINLRVAGEAGVYGVDPQSLELCDDGGFQVPKIIVNLKNMILEKGGINTEGIFRLAGEQTEIKRIKEQLNDKNYDVKTNDINAITSLLKIWFRELPIPVLNALPQESIMGFHDANDCLEAYQSLPEPNKSLLSWFIELMKLVVSNSAVNKMTAQNLAIVVAPNLYDINTPNPMEGLFLSQKCAAFLNHVLLQALSGNV